MRRARSRPANLVVFTVDEQQGDGAQLCTGLRNTRVAQPALVGQVVGLYAVSVHGSGQRLTLCGWSRRASPQRPLPGQPGLGHGLLQRRITLPEYRDQPGQQGMPRIGRREICQGVPCGGVLAGGLLKNHESSACDGTNSPRSKTPETAPVWRAA